jgi:tryptophanyl-tRNA synthetase
VELGYGEWKRNDAYKELRIAGGSARDVRRIDLALARAEQARGSPGLVRPAATFHRFMTGLQGGKMSSSKPETGVFLNESAAEAEKKVKRAVTGGRATAEEQRRLGADPTICPVYELYLYHLARDDAHLQVVHDECRGGQRLCGGCKGEAIGLLTEFLAAHKERRDEVAHEVERIVRED